MAEQNNQILLETKDLQKHFPIKDFFGRKKQARPRRAGQGKRTE